MSDLNSVESKWNSLSRVDKSILLNESNIDFIEAGMESYPTSEDYHTNSAYQTVLKQKLVEYASSPFNALPISVKDKVTETFRDQGIITEEAIDNDYKMEGEIDGSADSEGTDFSYLDTDKQVDDIEKEATEAYHYSLYTQVRPEGMSLKNLRKAREIVKDETDEFYSKYFDIAKEVEYPYKEEVPVTRPDNAELTGKYDDNPNAGLYDNKLFKKGDSNWDRQGEGFPQDNEIDRQREASEDAEDYNVYDTLKTDGIEEEEYTAEVESEDAEIAKPDEVVLSEEDHIPETNTNIVDAEKEATEEGDITIKDTYGGKSKDTYEEVATYDEVYDDDGNYSETCKKCGQTFDNPSDAGIHANKNHPEEVLVEGKTNGTEAIIPYSAETEIESKIIERKLAGHNPQSIARELGIWHEIELNEAIDKVNAVEVSTDDKAAYSLFGKRFTQITEVEKDEMKTLAGETFSPKEEEF